MQDVPETLQRHDLGRHYRGLPVHAGPGVHEHAATICIRLLRGGARILEVGAGSGAFAARLQDQGFQVVATDRDPAHPWIYPLDLEDPRRSDVIEGHFDMVVCVETIEHLENPRAALRSLRSILDVGDRLLITTPNILHPHSRLKMLLRGTPLEFDPHLYYHTGHITPLPAWLLTEHLRTAGFAVDLVERAGTIPYRTGRRRLVHRIEMAILRAAGVREDVTAGDGVCLFVVAVAT